MTATTPACASVLAKVHSAAWRRLRWDSSRVRCMQTAGALHVYDVGSAPDKTSDGLAARRPGRPPCPPASPGPTIERDHAPDDQQEMDEGGRPS